MKNMMRKTVKQLKSFSLIRIVNTPQFLKGDATVTNFLEAF